MSNNNDKIYIEFKDLFDELKDLSELKSRSMPDEVVDRFVVTDSDKHVIQRFYQDAVSDIADKLGQIGNLQDYGGTTIYNLNETQTKNGMKKTKNLLKKPFVNYMLYKWYRSVGKENLAAEYLRFYEQSVEQYRTNSTRTNFVKPNYKPWW